MKSTIKILKNNLMYNATIDERTQIATVKMLGMQYKFSKHEYEIVENV